MGGKHVFRKRERKPLRGLTLGDKNVNEILYHTFKQLKRRAVKKDGLKSRSVTDPKFKNNLSINTTIAGNT